MTNFIVFECLFTLAGCILVAIFLAPKSTDTHLAKIATEDKERAEWIDHRDRNRMPIVKKI